MSDVIVPDPTDKLACAVSYMRRGWHVFVLGAGKTPLPNCETCRQAGPEHNAEACTCLTCHGFYAGTLDEDRIEMMLLLHPNGDLAVRTGEKSGVIVVDAEGTADGDLPSGTAVLDAWETWVGGWSLPPTLTALTPSGGVHMWYQYVAGTRSRNRVLPGVDVKSDGGYVAVPCGTGPRVWLPGADTPQPAGPELSDWLRTAKGRGSGGSGGSIGHGTGYDYSLFAKDGCPGGHRDEFFNDMCFRLRRLGVAKHDAEQELRKHWDRVAQPPAAHWHMPWEHVAYKLERVWRTVAIDDDLPAWRGDIVPTPLPQDELRGAEVPIRLAELPSDLGNAERFIRLYGNDSRYISEMKRWMLWDGTHWVPDKFGKIHHLASKVADDVRRSADLAQDNDEQRVLARHALNTESLRSIKAMVEIAAHDPRIAMSVDDVDRDPTLLVVKNGVLNLRTGELQDGNRDDLCTRSASVTYDPEAEAPLWREHVRFVTKNNVLLAAYLRRAIGYSLTGLVKEQTFFMLEGNGSNGKNAFIEPVVALLGEYAQTGTSALITGGDEQHPTILADLIGARLVFIDEARQGRALNVERVKQLTGSKRVKARRMGKDFFEFDAHLKLWIAGNNHPTMRDPSDGIWRRLHRVLFKAKIPDSKKVGDYGQLLFDEEASGILNWALEGLKDYFQLNGLGQPDEVELATSEIRDEEDFVAQFLEECCEATGSLVDSVTVNELYIEFSMWATLAGMRLADRPTRVQFGRDLSNKGYERFQKRIGGLMQRGFRGLRLARRIGVE